MTKNKIYLVTLIAVFIIAIIGLFTGGTSEIIREEVSLGGVTNYDSLETAALAVGSGCDNEYDTCTGTTIARINNGTCTATRSSAAFAATSTEAWVCSDSNVESGDKIILTQGLPSNNGGTFNVYGSTPGSAGTGSVVGFYTLGAVATTSDQFSIYIANNTGAATSSINSAYRTFYYLILDN